jgi:NADH-quinone oxidoreductase subunit F
LSKKDDLLILFGGFPSIDRVNLPESNSLMHLNPIEDCKLEADRFIKFEVGSEEGLILMLAEHLIDKTKLSNEHLKYLEELDIGYISAESSVSEEEIESIEKYRDIHLCISNSIYRHKRIKNIISILSLLAQNSSVKISIQSTNGFEPFEASEIELEEIGEIEEFNGVIIYNYNGDENLELIGSEQFSKIAKLSDDDKVRIEFGGLSIERVFRLDRTLKGTIALNSDFDIDSNLYRYQRVKIDKVVENE